jgi:protein TonB
VKAAPKPEPKKAKVEKPVEVKKPEELKQPAVEVEEVTEPAVSHASYVTESTTEESSSGVETSGAAYSSGDETTRGEVAAEQGKGGESAEPSYGTEVSRDALLLQIRDAIQRELTYPPLARRRKLEGTVVAGFVIDRGGEPHGIEIVESSGFSILDKEVVEIIERASPYPRIPERVEVPVSFRLVTGR